MLELEQFWDGRHYGKFLKCVRTKTLKKICVGFWDQSAIMEQTHVLEKVFEPTYPIIMWLGDEQSGNWWGCDVEGGKA